MANTSTRISATCQAVLNVLDALQDNSLTLMRFLEALSWGDPDCIKHSRIQRIRTWFLQHRSLQKLIRCWYSPPRSKHSHKSRPNGARNVLCGFALETVRQLVEDELGKLDPLLRATEDLLNKEDILVSSRK